MRIQLSIFLLLTASACKEVTTFTDAGGDDDTTIDGATIDAPAAGTVTVVTRARELPDGPVEGSQVIAVAPDGTLRDSATTDATGTATLDVIAGDSVTAFYPPGPNSSQEVVTTLAVEPGDTLTYGTYPYDYAQTGEMGVSWQADAAVSSWYVYTDCGYNTAAGTTLSLVMPRYAWCGDATTDVLLVGTQPNTGYPLVWARLDDVAWGGAAAFTTTQAAPTVSMNVTGIPDEIRYFEIDAVGQLDRTRVYGSYAYASPPVGGAVTGTGPYVAGDGGFGQWYASRNGSGLGQQQGTVALTSATELTLDQPALLPFVSYPSISPAARAAIWVQTDGAPYDVAWFRMSYSTAPPAIVPGLPAAYYNWTILVPPGVTQLDFPALPDDYQQHLPPDNASIYGQLMLVEDERYDGYAGARNAAEWEIACQYQCPVDLARPRRTWSTYGGD